MVRYRDPRYSLHGSWMSEVLQLDFKAWKPFRVDCFSPCLSPLSVSHIMSTWTVNVCVWGSVLTFHTLVHSWCLGSRSRFFPLFLLAPVRAADCARTQDESLIRTSADVAGARPPWCHCCVILYIHLKPLMSRVKCVGIVLFIYICRKTINPLSEMIRRLL